MTWPSAQRRALITSRTVRDELRHRALSTVDCALPSTAVGADHTVTIGITITLGELPEGWRYVVAFVRGRFAPSTSVVDLRGPAEVTNSVSGVGDSTFGWYLGDFDRGTLPDEPLTMYAVLPASDVARTVELTLRADVSFIRPRFPVLPRRRLDHARAETPWTFQVGLPAGSGTPAAEQEARSDNTAAVRLCVATDIERYSRFRNPEAMRAQERFVELLRLARAEAGIDESAVVLESAGDSQFAILPSGLDETTVVPRLIDGLARALREANIDLSEHARLRVRVAIDRGLLTPSVNGWVGPSTIAVHRLLDSAALRTALAENGVADHALIVSETVHRDVVRHGYGGLVPEEFTETLVELPAKGFRERAWIHVPR